MKEAVFIKSEIKEEIKEEYFSDYQFQDLCKNEIYVTDTPNCVKSENDVKYESLVTLSVKDARQLTPIKNEYDFESGASQVKTEADETNSVNTCTSIKSEKIDIKLKPLEDIRQGKKRKRKSGKASKNISKENDVETYICDICGHQTKRKEYLKSHMLVHKDPTEIRMYKCTACSFSTKYKRCLNNHKSVHLGTGPQDTYTCNLCCYTTKRRRYLKTHMLVHKDPAEIQMHKCVACNFVTKHKNALVAHAVTHSDPSEKEKFKCDQCDYSSHWICRVKRHSLIHKKASAKSFTCSICGCKFNRKGDFNKHMRAHGEFSDVE